MSKYKLDGIPVTSIIANYPSNGATNVVASSVTKYIADNWSSGWNGGNSFLFFNQYTPDWGKSTDFSDVSTYFSNVQTAISSLTGAPQVFVGETGYSAEYNTKTADNQPTVIGDMFTWLGGQQTNGAISTPLCVFQAFDQPNKPTGQQQMGLFEYSNGTAGVKSGITIPTWTNSPITTGS